MGARWIKISVIYFILGLAIGLFMSATLQLQWAAGHAHVNLAGWASIAIIGVIYSVYPEAGNNAMGKWSFWLYNLGMPILLLSMFMIQIPSVRGSAHTLTFTGGTMVIIGVIIVAVNVFLNVHESNAKTRG